MEYVEILEEPASKALRFRYECEGRNAGALFGANSKPDAKTFPKIRIVGYEGPAVLIISCVTDTKPYRQHPYKVVSREREKVKGGAFTMKLIGDDMTVTLEGLGVQCVKKMELEESLKERQSLNIDPFKAGFNHINRTQMLNLEAVRLCFQVFKMVPGQKPFPLPPIVSNPIYDKKTKPDLVILDISDESSPVSGERKIILISDKVKKGKVAIRFYEKNANDDIIWEVIIKSNNENKMIIRRQIAITFWTPPYRHQDIDKPVSVFLQLFHPHDNSCSAPIDFTYFPIASNGMSMLSCISMRRKTKKSDEDDKNDKDKNNLANKPKDETKNGNENSLLALAINI